MKLIFTFIWFLIRLFTLKLIKGEDVKVSKDKRDKRLNTCLNCPLLKTDGLLCRLKGPRCSICGCFVFWKTLFKCEDCPDKPSRW